MLLLSLPLSIHSSLRKQLPGTPGVLLGILGRVCRQVLKILTIFLTKKGYFSNPLSDLGLGLFLESPDNFSGPESCFLFAAFAFRINVSIILKINKVKLSVNEAKLTGLCMGKELCYYSTGLDFKICFRSEKLPGLSRNRPLAFKKLCHHYID